MQSEQREARINVSDVSRTLVTCLQFPGYDGLVFTISWERMLMVVLKDGAVYVRRVVFKTVSGVSHNYRRKKEMILNEPRSK